jgi:hypothetical protein
MSVLKPAALFAFIFGLVSQSSFCSANDDANTRLREDVSTAVGEAIRLLEMKDYETFLKDFVSPDDLKKIAEEKVDLSKLATRFKGEKADRLLRALKTIKNLTPTFEKNGELAVFPVKLAGSNKNSITFVKVGKYWYIKN